jgi:hypothetical protein
MRKSSTTSTTLRKRKSQTYLGFQINNSNGRKEKMSYLLETVPEENGYITDPMPWTRKIKWSMTVFSPSLISKPSIPRLTISGRICPSCQHEHYRNKQTYQCHDNRRLRKQKNNIQQEQTHYRNLSPVINWSIIRKI